MTFLRISALLAAVAMVFDALSALVTNDYGYVGEVFSSEDLMQKVRVIKWMLQPALFNLPLAIFFTAVFLNKPKEGPPSLPQ